MADEKLQFDITAKDTASKVLDGVQDKVDKLEGDDVEIDVTADAKAADHTVEDFAAQLDKLTDTDKVIVLALRAAAAQTELRDLAGDLALIDASDPDIAVKFDRYAEVSGQLDHLETQITELGDAGADMHKVEQRLDGIGEGAGKAGDAVHSMAGNAIGDFAATATGIGPLGEALGQLSETALGAEGSIREIATAGAGMAGMAATMYVIQKAMQAIADTKAFHKEEVDAWRESIEMSEDAATSLADRLEKAGKVEGATSGFGAKMLGLKDAVSDLTPTLLAAGLNVEQYSQLVAGSTDDVLAWAQAQKDSGELTPNTVAAIQQIVAAQKDYAAAQDAAVVSADFFTDSQAAQNAEAERWTAMAAAYQSANQGAAKTQRDMAAAAERVNRSLDAQVAKLDALRSDISDDQAWLDLQDAFDGVRDSGQAAMDAQVEANKTYGKTWQEMKADQDAAKQAMRDHESQINTTKQAVIEYGTTVLGLPADQVTNIVTHVDDRELDNLEDRLARIKQNAIINAQIIDRGGAGYGPITGPRSAPMPTLVAAAAPARWARINGR